MGSVGSTTQKATTNVSEVNPSRSLRNICITLLVTSLLFGAAAIGVWQLNVGGTGQWITWTLTGLSSAFLLGSFISSLIYLYNRNKANLSPSSEQPSHQIPKRSSIAPTPQPLPAATTSTSLLTAPAATAMAPSPEPRPTLQSLPAAATSPSLLAPKPPVSTPAPTPIAKVTQPPSRPVTKDELEKMCKEGAPIPQIINMMIALKLTPRSKWDGTSVFDLLIESKNASRVREFLETIEARTNQPFMITNADTGKAFKDPHKSREVIAVLMNTRQKQQAQRVKNFNQLAQKVTDQGNCDALQFTNEFATSGLTVQDEAEEGPYKGKTILQLAIEVGATQYFTPIKEVHEGNSGLFNPTFLIDFSAFFFGNISKSQVDPLRVFCGPNFSLSTLCKRDNELRQSLEKCSLLSGNSHHQNTILRLMREHQFQSDTVFPLMKCKTPLQVARENGAQSRELYTSLLMMAGQPDMNEIRAVHAEEIANPPKGLTLFQKGVEANNVHVVKELVVASGGKKIDTSKFFLGNCSDEVLAELAKVSTSSAVDLRAQKKKGDDLIYGKAMLKTSNALDVKRQRDVVKRDVDTSSIHQNLNKDPVDPEALMAGGKQFIQVIAEEGELLTLQVFVKRLNGRKILPKAVFDSYEPGDLKPECREELKKIVIESDEKSPK